MPQLGRCREGRQIVHVDDVASARYDEKEVEPVSSARRLSGLFLGTVIKLRVAATLPETDEMKSKDQERLDPSLSLLLSVIVVRSFLLECSQRGNLFLIWPCVVWKRQR